jgi:hypothetical protein
MLSQNVVTNDNRGDCLLNNQVVSLSVPTNGWVPVPGSNDVTKKNDLLGSVKREPKSIFVAIFWHKVRVLGSERLVLG